MNVGILGCGIIADLHLPHLINNELVGSISIADLDRKKAEQIAQRYGIRNVYSSLEEMLRQQSIDVVHILTPPATHARLAIQAMEAGCHVLVEKPMALSSAEAQSMVDAAQRNAVKLGVDLNFLMSPVLNQVYKLVESGRAGRLTHVDVLYSYDIRRSTNLNRTVGGQVDWAFRLPIGPLADHLPHPASILLHFLPEPYRLWSVAKRNGLLPDGFPDELRVLVDSQEATGLLSVSFGVKPDTILVNLYGTEATVHANLSNMTVIVRENKKVPKKLLRVVDSLSQSAQLFSGSISSTMKVLRKRTGPPGDVGPVIQSFYESIENGTETLVSGEAGKRVVLFTDEVTKQIGALENAGAETRTREMVSVGEPASEIKPKVLVTGGTGFLGSHLVSRLVQDGQAVRVLARKMSSLEHLPRSGVEVVYGDLRDKESLRRAMEGIDVVYHAGAAMKGSWEDYVDSTVGGTERLLELSLAAGVKRFVHISSLTVYQTTGFKRGSVIEESSPYEKDPQKVGAYAYTKLESEKLAFEYYRKGLPVVVLRPGVIYGPRGITLFPHVGFSPTNRLIVMVGRGANLLPLTYIDNTVEAILLAGKDDRAIGEAFTIVDDGDITQKEYLKRYLEATDIKASVLAVPFVLFLLPISMLEIAGRLGIIKKKRLPSRYGLASKYYSLRFSSEKAKRLLAWQPRVSLEEGLRRTFDWYNQTHAKRRAETPQPGKSSSAQKNPDPEGLSG